MMMDCDYYFNLRSNYGDPIYLNDVLITNRVHPNQISSTYNKNIQDEIDYCLDKYATIIES